MQFILIGDHRDGLSVARALLATGRYRLAVYAGPDAGADALAGVFGRRVAELEEALAVPGLELAVVADALPHRAAVLRRALQSDLHVLCVHPVDIDPAAAYEATMIQNDTRKVLVPMLVDRFTPGLVRVQTMLANSELGALEGVEYDRCLPPGAEWPENPLLTLWDGLRYLLGELADVSAFVAQRETLKPWDPVTLSGQFETGTMFQIKVAPEIHDRLRIRGKLGHVEVQWPNGWAGEAIVNYRSKRGEGTETVAPQAPWPLLIQAFEQRLAWQSVAPGWADEVRALEILDAVQESVERRRVIPLIYQKHTEAVGFKGVMAAVGCGMIWMILLLMLASPWLPWVVYLVPLLLGAFLLMQIFRLALPPGQR
jgi:predicted dehydrogenase